MLHVLREFTTGVAQDEYLKDRKLQLAVERALEIIGEAARPWLIREAARCSDSPTAILWLSASLESVCAAEGAPRVAGGCLACYAHDESLLILNIVLPS
jgi:hypothetical protein